jgi:hypothetical protein
VAQYSQQRSFVCLAWRAGADEYADYGGLARSFARLSGSGPAWFDIAALLIIFIWVAALLRSIIRSQP